MFTSHPGASLAAGLWAIARRTLPAPALRRIKRVAGREVPAVGGVEMGHLARLHPISRQYGEDRGTPIDRHYIEAFLSRNAGSIRGSVLEIGAPTYSKRFGRDIAHLEVLHVDEGSPEATLVGDLAQQGILPDEMFDCQIVTQTLQLVYDIPAALHELRRSLKPGGVLLATVPGITASIGEWDRLWCWSLTKISCERLFGEVFGAENVQIEVHGNVYAATTFLQGLAAEEVERDWLDKADPAYPVTIAVRARREA